VFWKLSPPEQHLAEDRPKDTVAAWRFVAWVLFFAVVTLTIWPFDMAPDDPISTDSGRIEAYGILSLAFMLAFPNRPSLAMALPIACAIADELLPTVVLFAPFNVADSLWKLVGITLGFAAGRVWNLRFRKDPP